MECSLTSCLVLRYMRSKECQHLAWGMGWRSENWHKLGGMYMLVSMHLLGEVSCLLDSSLWSFFFFFTISLSIHVDKMDLISHWLQTLRLCLLFCDVITDLGNPASKEWPPVVDIMVFETHSTLNSAHKIWTPVHLTTSVTSCNTCRHVSKL
jgi:hypothetical protein